MAAGKAGYFASWISKLQTVSRPNKVRIMLQKQLHKNFSEKIVLTTLQLVQQNTLQ